MCKIYESPDGGKTIYSREFGSQTRQLHSKSIDTDKIVEKHEWNEIYKLQCSNPALKKAIENVILIYKVIKDEQSR